MKTILALALLCLTFNARGATYMLLSQTNAFAAGITNLAKAYTDAHTGGGSTNLDNLTVTNDTRLFGPLYQGIGTMPYWLGDNSDGIISLHITDLGENPQNKMFLGAVDHNSQGTAMNIAYMHFIPDENDPGFQFRILCDTNFQGAIPSAGLYVNARMSGNEANMRLLNNLGATNFAVLDDASLWAFGAHRTSWPTGGGNVTNTGPSVVGMIPVYTDTSGTAVTPTNSVDLTGINVGTLYLSNMVANVTPVFDGNTNLVPSATSTNDLNAIAGKATVLGHYMGTDTNALLSALGGAPISSPTFTGTATAPTAAIATATIGTATFTNTPTVNGVPVLTNASGGNVLSTGASTAGALPAYTGTDGTNVAPSSVTVTSATNLNAGALILANGTGLRLRHGGTTNSLSLEQADSNTAGNALGVGATDLQIGRQTNTKVASGANAFAAGTNNVASGSQSIALGQANTSSGFQTIAMGNACSASGDDGFAVGSVNTAGGSFSSAFGNQSSSPRTGQQSLASGFFAALADAQTSIMVARNTTSGNTPAVLYLNGSNATLTIPANTTWAFNILIAARSTDAGTGDEESAGYEEIGLIERDNTAANTRIVGTVTERIIAEDDAAWSVSVTADTTNGALTITCTGNNETLVRWVATIRLTQVGG